MKRSFFKSLSDFPTSCGVYIMKDALDNVLYIGKSNNIKNRLKQYRQAKDLKLLSLLDKVRKVETITVMNEREALILESNLIHEHFPKYNVKLKDDKRFFSIHFTKDRWKTLILKRDVDVENKSFGPYPSSKMARSTLKFLHQLFPLRECSDKELNRRKRPCILYELKRCIAPCVNMCSQKEYDEVVKRAKSFLSGDTKTVRYEIKKKIKEYSKKLEFEKAEELFNTLQHLDELFSSQTVSYTKAKNFDVFSLRLVSAKALIVELNFKNYKLTSLKKHFFFETLSNKEQLLSQFLRQHYVTNPLPQLVVLPFDLPDKKYLEEFFTRLISKRLKLVFPKRGEKLKFLELANKNLDVIWQSKESTDTRILQKTVGFCKEPIKIIAIDTSYCTKQNGVASIVIFTDLKKTSQLFFKTEKKDDYSVMREALFRYFKRDPKGADLLLVDGGKGQLKVAVDVKKKMNIVAIEIIAIAKKNHTKSLVEEKIFLENMKDPILLDKKDPSLQILQRIRDEAHRVTIGFYRKCVNKRVLKKR